MGKNLVYNGCMKYLLELRTVLKFQIKQHKGPGNFEVPYPYYFVSNIIFALYAHGYDQLQPHHLILSMYLTSFSLFLFYVLCRPFLEQVVLYHLCVDLNKTRTILEHLIQMLLAHSPINMSLPRVLFEINSNPKQKLLIHDRLITIQSQRFGAKEFIIVMVYSPLSTALQCLNSKEIFLDYNTR